MGSEVPGRVRESYVMLHAWGGFGFFSFSVLGICDLVTGLEKFQVRLLVLRASVGPLCKAYPRPWPRAFPFFCEFPVWEYV